MSYLYKVFVLVLLLALSASGQAAIIWVGSSAACTGSNVFASLPLAIFEAGVNGQSTDEIRLTNTVVYTGNNNGKHILTDWDVDGSGYLTIVGGYANCFTAATGQTVVGYSNGSSFTVNTNSKTNSVVTLKNLILRNNDSRGLVVTNGGIVTLDNVEIRSNQYSGVDVQDGGFVEILANSVVRNNENFNNPFGGGIRCTGINSSVLIHGLIEKNRAQKGGNLFASTGCYIELKDGMRIRGNGVHDAANRNAEEGGGAYIDDGGSLFADGRANRVIFDANTATRNGGGLYLNGTGFALLQNTHFDSSLSQHGAAIFGHGGGQASPQLIMDQTITCHLLFRCSEIQNSHFTWSVVGANNSLLQISRTVIELSHHREFSSSTAPLVRASDGGKLRLNRVGILRNEAGSVLSATNGTVEATHVTIAANQQKEGQDSFSIYSDEGTFNIQNTIINNTSGAHLIGNDHTISGRCNLLDDDADWPPVIYHSGFAQFVNASGGDGRQTASSLGVDMCQQDSFAWSSEVDIENEDAPVNESTNPQGLPGDDGGLYDAGFDEVYDNVGPAFYQLTINKSGTGDGHVFDNTFIIDCGSNCSGDYEEGSSVTIAANPTDGSDFTAWQNCPSVSSSLCFIQLNSDLVINAVFDLKPSSTIFSDSFE